MAKKSESGRGMWIFGIVIAFNILQGVVGDTAAVILLIAGVVIFFVAKDQNKSLLGKEGLLDTFISELEKQSMKQGTSYAPKEPTNGGFYKNSQSEYKDVSETHLDTATNQSQNLSGNDIMNNPAYVKQKQLKKNYFKPETIIKDDLNKKKTNPFSLNGK